MRLEELCPTGTEVKGDSAHAHLDLLLCNSDIIVGVESKFAEILSSQKKVAFSKRYKRRCALGSARLLGEIEKEVGKYNRLDAAQLVKHYLGLRNCIRECTREGGRYEGHKALLLYLFWEPINWEVKEEYKEHRDNIEAFKKVIKKLYGQDEDHQVDFKSLSYLDLWKEWDEKKPKLDWQEEHLKYLRERYQFAL